MESNAEVFKDVLAISSYRAAQPDSAVDHWTRGLLLGPGTGAVSATDTYASPLAAFQVHDADGKPVNKSLSQLSNGYPMILYFWSGADPQRGEELDLLVKFRAAHASEFKILPVAFAVGGDEKNQASRKVSKSYPTLDIYFDDNRKLYLDYCPGAEESLCRSAFLIDSKGTIITSRTKDERAQPLVTGSQTYL